VSDAEMRLISWSIMLLVLVVAGGAGLASPQETGKSLPPAVMTAEEDHRRMMKLLGIASLRPGANGNDPKAPNAANYDESKANPYPVLPDPLVLKNGRKVTTARAWWTKRRAEIVEDFDREIYGRVPRVTPKVKWEVVSLKRETNGDVPVVTEQLVGHVDNSSDTLIKVDIELTLTTPANATRPVFVGVGSPKVEGGWVDAKGMFMAAAAAGPVYRLLGRKDMSVTEFPPMETALIDGDVAFRQHSGRHTNGPNWPTFLAFASRYLKGPPPANIPKGYVGKPVVQPPETIEEKRLRPGRDAGENHSAAAAGAETLMIILSDGYTTG